MGDTLSCFPFRANDPFLIAQCPHCYFSGNNEVFRCDTMEHPDKDYAAKGEKVCLVQCPSFTATRQIVLRTLKPMQPQPIQIGKAPEPPAEVATPASTAAEE